MNLRPLLLAAVLGGFAAPAVAAAEPALREGDIVFSGSLEGQGRAVMQATESPYTHCGIVFLRDGRPMVLEATQPVRVASLEAFKQRAKPGTFMARRLRDGVALRDLDEARRWAEEQIGKDYDLRFRWSDERMYCSELVWKIYQKAGVRLCEPRKFRDYKLDDPAVREVIEERYGKVENLPPDEDVVAPADIAVSPLLVEVAPAE